MTTLIPPTSFNSQRVDRFEMTPTPEQYPTRGRSTLRQISEFCTTYFNPKNWIYSSESPPQIALFDPNKKTLSQEIVAFGDIHGAIYGFIENLLNAGLINQKGEWIGKDSILVQLGDVIDRGFASEASWNYLASLQAQAENSSGQVIRLIGNHELMVLQGDYHNAIWVIANPPLFAQKVRQEIINRKVQLAYTDGKRLFVHAGLRSEMRHLIVKEILEEKQCLPSEIYLQDIVDYLNELLIEAVSTHDFSHPIFQVGHSRGGSHTIGGILWEDMSEILHSNGAREIPQVIGHNPPRGKSHPPIRITDSHRLVEVDAGLNPLYGGRRAYVVFNSSEIKVRAKDPDQQWMEWIAKDYLLNTPPTR